MAEQIFDAGRAKNIRVCFGRSAASGTLPRSLPRSRRHPPRRLFLSAQPQAGGELTDSSVGWSEDSSHASDDGQSGSAAEIRTDSDSDEGAESAEAPRPLPSPVPDAARPNAANEEEILRTAGKRFRREYLRVKAGLPGSDKAEFRGMTKMPAGLCELLFDAVYECERVPLLDLKVLFPEGLEPRAPRAGPASRSGA
jgi:hypothetical protein